MLYINRIRSKKKNSGQLFSRRPEFLLLLLLYVDKDNNFLTYIQTICIEAKEFVLEDSQAHQNLRPFLSNPPLCLVYKQLATP